jgi:hypothetical protein
MNWVNYVVAGFSPRSIRWKQTPGATAALVLLSLLVFGSPATAQSSQQAAPAVSAQDLDKQIDEVIHESNYTWRMPHAAALKKENDRKGVVSRFLDNISDMLRRALRSTFQWIDTVLRDWLGSGNTDPASGPGYNWMTSSGLLYTLLALVVVLLGVFLFQARRRRSTPIVAMNAEAIAYTPDIADENIGADQLPEDGWISLAQGLLERGEFRLAIRAFYLSTLAHLAHHNLISIAKFKSNRDYENELRRRAHSLPELLPVFEANVSTFERIWYGMHEVNLELIHQFAANVEQITGLKALRQL